MKKKIKLRDITEEQYQKWRDGDENINFPCKHKNCSLCLFLNVYCCIEGNCWVKHKDMYSDKFLNQEIEIEVPDILTKEEKDYLKAVIAPFKPCILFVSKNEGDTPNEYIGIFCKKSGYENFLLSCFPTSPSMRFDGLENDKRYTLEDLGL